MDGRWLLLSLVLAAIAAVRWRQRAPRDQPPGPDSAPPADRTGSAPPVAPPTGPHSAATSAGPRPPEPASSSPTDASSFDAWAQARMDAQLDAHLDAQPDAQPNRPTERAARRPGPGGRGSEPARPGQPDGILGMDGLGAALDRVWAEHAGAADTLLDARLRLIVHRGIPARAIRPAPGARTIRVVFADGTIVLCRGTGQGDFGRLGLALQQHRSVRLGSFTREVDGTRLEFRWHPNNRLAATAVGLDQPD